MTTSRRTANGAYRRHVLVCTGGFCSPDRRGRALYSLLASLLEREDLLFGPTRVKRGETPCLGVCAGGPIVVVYPEGVWYAGVTPDAARAHRRRAPARRARGGGGGVPPPLHHAGARSPMPLGSR